MRKDVVTEILIKDVRSFKKMLLNYRGRHFTVNGIKKDPNMNIILDESEINYAISELVRKRLVIRIGDKYYTRPLTRRRTLRQRHIAYK